MAERIVAANNFWTGYAKSLIAGTAENDLASTEKATVMPSVRPEDLARSGPG